MSCFEPPSLPQRDSGRPPGGMISRSCNDYRLKVEAAAILEDFGDLKDQHPVLRALEFPIAPGPTDEFVSSDDKYTEVLQIQGPRRGDEAEQLDIPVC